MKICQNYSKASLNDCEQKPSDETFADECEMSVTASCAEVNESVSCAEVNESVIRFCCESVVNHRLTRFFILEFPIYLSAQFAGKGVAPETFYSLNEKSQWGAR